jgi:uncharacterized glyoxalase superfamily protein PhnB
MAIKKLNPYLNVGMLTDAYGIRWMFNCEKR